jgi:hypothetical protein
MFLGLGKESGGGGCWREDISSLDKNAVNL